MKTKEELLKKRYLVIADFWHSPFEINDVITLFEEDGCTVMRDKYGDLHFIDEFDYPHLFRELQWWEFRDESDMPKYVKVCFERIEMHNHVLKVISWKYHNDELMWVIYESNELWNIIHINYLQPSDETEYNEYLKTKL